MSPVHKSKNQHHESVQLHVAVAQHCSLPHRCLETAITAPPEEIIVVLLYLADHLVVALGTGALLGEDFENFNSLHQCSVCILRPRIAALTRKGKSMLLKKWIYESKFIECHNSHMTYRRKAICCYECNFSRKSVCNLKQHLLNLKLSHIFTFTFLTINKQSEIEKNINW